VGYQPEGVVYRFCKYARGKYPFRVMGSMGFANQQYFPKRASLQGQPKEECHHSRTPNTEYIAFNSDHRREHSQRAFLSDVGAPGGFTLYAHGNKRHHMPLAEQVCAKRLAGKMEQKGVMIWSWSMTSGPVKGKPRIEDHWGDAVSGCWVAAASLGLTTSGEVIAPRKRRALKVRHVKI